MSKIAFITGITGQSGSYLAELLLKKGYEVHGLTRRLSTPNLTNIKNILSSIHLIEGDLMDQGSLDAAVRKIKPDEVYNLAAQSFVATSWTQPILTHEITALGAVRLFESVRNNCFDARIYQASSSEMFGSSPAPQNENTPFKPRSPYGCAKVFAHNCAVNYRESYGMFISCGICFNHECITAQTPIIIKRNGYINILPIEEIVPHREDPKSGKKQTSYNNSSIEVWNGGSWTKIKIMTATWNDSTSPSDKNIKRIVCRGGYYEATSDHISFLKGGQDIKTQDLKKGDRLELKPLPDLTRSTVISIEEAEFLGMMVADGYISKEGKGRFVKNDDVLREHVAELWGKIANGTVSETTHTSGFDKNKAVKSVEFNGNGEYLRFIWSQIYTEKLYKKIPIRILNADETIITAFLKGYNKCDGLKEGHQKTEYKSFKTNSSVLAMGLWYLVDKIFHTRMTLHPEFRGDRVYYGININSDNNSNGFGEHLKREISEIKSIYDLNYTGWLFDLETDSGTYSAGVGLTWIHNSPRRGIEFVTRKITDGVAKIKLGKSKYIEMGNLDAKRDWGFAGDFCNAMWHMLQLDKPDDFVIATRESHTVKEFVEKALECAGLESDIEKYVRINPKFIRPAEVNELRGDYSKANKAFGWSPKVKFEKLVKIMVENDIDLTRGMPYQFGSGHTV